MKLRHLMDAITEPGRLPPTDRTKTAAAGCRPGIDPDTEIGAIQYRAQAVHRGDLFVAIPGRSADGHDFIPTALANGAAAIVAQRNVDGAGNVITVGDTRRAMGEMAARFYGNPADRLHMTGITGTNGKTTTTYLLESILTAAGHAVGVIGTINCRYNGRTFDSPVTTPESADLQRLLADMRRNGVTHVVMEVSSHGIDMQRIGGCRFDLAVFTNLTQDHLDYHRTMAAYWQCKQRLFTEYLRPDSGMAVVNVDDPRGKALADRLSTAVSTGRAPGCAVRPVDDRYDLQGITAQIVTPAGPFPCRSLLVGRHNMENILCAAGAGIAMGLPVATVKAGIERMTTVPGRLEPVANDRQRFVFVDYAHTPDALASVLAAVRAVSRSRLILVFGCGGDRDKGKRPLMGEIAAKNSDLVIVTSDNPRGEDPGEIIGQILAGMHRDSGRRYTARALAEGFTASGFAVEPDRRAAIALAVAASGPRDAILVAGKGHETYQILGDHRVDFDDRQVVRDLLNG